jgi:hypothetical protein
MVEEVEGSPGVTEAVRIGVDVVLTLLCIYVMWGYVKERPEVEAALERGRAWWTKVTTQGARMKKMENETVYEAIQVVTDDAGT